MVSTVSVKAASTKNFDYSHLDAQTSEFVQQQTGEIRTLMKRTVRDIIEIGCKLIEVKKLLGYGQYRKWIEAEFNWGKSTANAFENVAKQFADVQNLDKFAPSALYELASSSTPKLAREEAITRAQAGETITYTISKEIKRKYFSDSHKSSSKSSLPSSSLESGKQSNSQKSIKHASSVISTSSDSEKSQLTIQNSLKPKQEIIAIEQKPKKNLSLLSEKPTIFLPSPTAAEKIPPRSWWQLGNNHLLYCGNSHSPEFQAYLPARVPLIISFPATADWHLGRLAQKVNSSLILFSHYDDVDFKPLRNLVRNTLELYTNGDETVVFAFIPDPGLLLLAEQLCCHCIIAEPDPQRCQAAIQAWTQVGGRVKIKQ
jgi:hypothetical protein